MLQAGEQILGHLPTQRALRGQLGKIGIQLEDLEGAGEGLHPPHGLQALRIEGALEYDGVRRVTLKIGNLQQVCRQRTIDQPRSLHRGKWLDYPLLTAALQVGIVRQHHRQRTPAVQRAPGQRRLDWNKAALMLQGQIGVVRRVAGKHRQPASVQCILLLDSRWRCCLGCHQHLHMGCPDIQVARLLQLQAQIDIDPAHQQRLLIETTRLEKQLSAQHQAFAAERGIILIDQQPLQVAGILVGTAFEGATDWAT
ncbi:hypothetical protein D3C77_209040 [compost metagenome]